MSCTALTLTLKELWQSSYSSHGPLARCLSNGQTVECKPTPQPTTEPTGVTCQVMQGPPGPPGTCSYTEVNLIKGVKDISTSLTESIHNLTTELTSSNNDLRISLQKSVQKLTNSVTKELREIKQEIAQISAEEPLCPRSLGLSTYKPAK